VVNINNKRMAPEGIEVAHPAFDITPNKLVTSIITEEGIARPPFTQSLRAMAQKK
jgi:methylthioribose-1-phosphate isomerase